MIGIKRKINNLPYNFILLFGLLLFSAILTYIIPSGAYQRNLQQIASGTRTVVVPDSYQLMPKYYPWQSTVSKEQRQPHASVVSAKQLLMVIPKGLQKSINIILFILAVGGTFGILRETLLLQNIVISVTRQFVRFETATSILLMMIFAALGTFFGMLSEMIILVPLLVSILEKVGYSRIFILGLIILANDVGFAAGITNPFTTGVAQEICNLPLYSGMSFRALFFCCSMAITIFYVLQYGKKTKRPLLTNNQAVANISEVHIKEETNGKKVILSVVPVVSMIGCLLCGFIKWHWQLPEVTFFLLLMAATTATLYRLNFVQASIAFLKGVRVVLFPCMLIGIARAIEILLSEAFIIDTLVYYANSLLSTLPTNVSAIGMLVFQGVLNFFVTSGSAQAALSMPIMAALADTLDISRQLAVFIFQCGDGLTNFVFPPIIAVLVVAGVSYHKWLRFVFPLFCQLFLLSILFICVGVYIGV